MLVTNVIKDSFIDYEGEQSLVVFTKGCNLDCDVCYNKKVNPEFEKELLDVIEENLTKLHTAIVISGGEPTIHPDLYQVTKSIKNLYPYLKIKIFSNGQIPDIIFDCLDFVDMWSIDYKTRNNTKLLGVDNSLYEENVFRTLMILKNTNKNYKVRIWKHPLTTKEELLEMMLKVKHFTDNYELVDILL